MEPSGKNLSGKFTLKAAASLTLACALFLSAAWAVRATLSYSDTLKFTPVEVSLQDGTEPQQAEALRLFDRDTRTGFTPDGTSLVTADLESSGELRAIRIYGSAHYTLNVEAEENGTWQPVPGLQNRDLSELSEGWNTLETPRPMTVGKVRFQLIRTGDEEKSGLKEIEIWGKAHRVAIKSGSALLDSLNGDNPPFQARKYDAKPQQGVIMPAATDDLSDNIFSFQVDRKPSDFKKVYLSYELYGLSHWEGTLRTINGKASMGGQQYTIAGSWSTQVEAIDPALLTQGNNAVQFFPVQGMKSGYTVRNVKLIGELEDGSNFVSQVALHADKGDKLLPALTDGDLNTGWSLSETKKSGESHPQLVVSFDRPTQVSSLNLNLSGTLKGKITVEFLHDGEWVKGSTGGEEKDSEHDSAEVSSFTDGWNSLGIRHAPVADSMRISLDQVSGSGEIRELSLTGSGVGGREGNPDLHITYPDAGQFIGRTAYIRGYVTPADNGSGPASVTIGNLTVSTKDGAFEALVSKDDLGFKTQHDSDAWSAEVKATYPDGKKLSTTVRLNNYSAPVPASANPNLPDYSYAVEPGENKKLDYDGAELEIGAGAIDGEMTFGITPLKESDLPKLDPGMVNVTRGAVKGYRFTPHGAKFRNKIKVHLPYDKALLPKGATEQEIKTYYYDETAGRWRELERMAVDPVKGELVSYTNHFTNMINATVTVPDHPGLTSFNPTSIKDIKAADPGAGINLIEPPQANNMGDARLSYPIEIPPGRNGMQPQIAVNYNSSGGNGWMGLGWDIPVQSITVDTRWGVPRYDKDNETETYLLDGEQLTPVAHRGVLQPRDTSGSKVFHPRVEGQFRKIVRLGNSPSTYSWEVTDKNGTKYIYGGDPQAVLSGQTDNNIFRWMLRQVRDTNGNTISYIYDHVASNGGTQIYLKEIRYTGSSNLPAPYNVTFIRDRELSGFDTDKRKDISVDARAGFKVVTADLLKKIEVKYNGALVRSYGFGYEIGEFYKTRLKSVTQYGDDGKIFNTHEFGYYDNVLSNGNNVLGAASTWTTQSEPGLEKNILGSTERPSLLSGATGSSWGVHAYFGYNPWGWNKSGSAGFKAGYGQSSTDGTVAFVDIDGDGLPDKVFRSGNGYAYRKNLSGPKGQETFGPQLPIDGLNAISHEESSTLTLGGENYIAVSAMADASNIFTTTDAYLTDVNGDGLVDLVYHGTVYFNHLVKDSRGNVPTFTPNSVLTPVPLGASTRNLDPGLVKDIDNTYQDQLKSFPLLDGIKRWVAPYDGEIQISGAVRLLDVDPADASATAKRKEYKTADGVRVAVQQNGTELWDARIQATDFNDHLPSGVNRVSVRKGDRIYFRVQSVFDGAYDQVAWNPTIQYLNVSTITDANNLDQYHYNAAQDFVYAGRGAQVQAPMKGTLRIAGNLMKLVTTDDISFNVYKIDLNRNKTLVNSKPMTWDASGSVSLQDIKIDVNPGERIELRVGTDSPIDLHKIQFNPILYYDSAVDASGNAITVRDAQGKNLFDLKAPYDSDVYSMDNLASPQQGFKAPIGGSVAVNAIITYSTLYNSPLNKTVVFTVKGKNKLLAKKVIIIQGGTVLGNTVTLNVPIVVNNVTAGEDLYFDYSTRDTGLASSQVSFAADFAGSPVPFTPLHWSVEPGAFPQAYRGWGYIAYNGNVLDASGQVLLGATFAPINESEFVLPPFSDTNTAAQVAKNTKVYVFSPVPGDGKWRGQEDTCWVNSDQMSSARLGKQYIEPFKISISTGGADSPGYVGAFGVSRVGHGDQFSASIMSLSGGTGNSTGKMDFMDMNGDRFPDIVGNGVIQYSDMTGGIGSKTSGFGGDIRNNYNETISFSLGTSILAIPSGKGIISGIQPEMGSLGISGTAGTGSSEDWSDLIDINGDGLPDRVDLKHGLVSLNLGYGFGPAEPWPGLTVNLSRSINMGGGIDFGYVADAHAWGGGITKNLSLTYAKRTLMDINGDGLPDLVETSQDPITSQNGTDIWVSFNKGTEFAAPIKLHSGTQISKNTNVSAGGGGYFTIIIPIPLTPSAIIINPGGNYSESLSRQEYGFRDVDGDGYPDLVNSTDDGSMTVWKSNIGKTNLLKTVKRPLGATITLEYQREGNTYEMPQSKWVLSKTIVDDGMARVMTQPNDGGAHTLATSYQYKDGYQDRLERDFYGFKTVVESQLDTANGNKLYRQIERVFNNQDYYQKGLLLSETLKDDAGLAYTRTENSYVTVPDLATLSATEKLTAAVFPQLTRTTKHFYEGGKGDKSTYTTYKYDANGNVTEFFDAGEPGTTLDDVTAAIHYFSDLNNYIIGKPDKISVTANGVEVRRREAAFEVGTGNLLQVREYLGDGTSAITDLKYNPNGTLLSVTGPENLHKQRYAVSYQYDPETQSYVTRISDSFGLSSTATYNFKYGRIELSTDSNGNLMTTAYDSFGRISAVKGPYEQGGQLATLSFEYHPSTGSGQVQEPPVNYAVTKHLDMYRNVNDPIETVLFTDGLKRVIQTKKDDAFSTGRTGTPKDGMSVSGRVKFDGLGRIVEQYYPVEEGLGSQSVFNPKYDTITPTRMTYDVLDRNLTTTLPDTTVTRMDYGFGNDRNGLVQFATTVIDANGKSKTSFRDVNELITAVKESNNGATIWTSYQYDPLKQITQVMDDQKNLTLITYDNLGRRTSIDNPDTGKTETIYDLAGNVTAKITANLRAENKQITYDYDFGRLVSISYPDFPENNVTYTYGPAVSGLQSPVSANGAGRIVKVTDGSGTEERFYGKLGEIVKEIKTIKLSAVSDQHSAEKNSESRSQKSEEKKDSEIDTRQSSIVTYTTQYTYDTFGRIQKLVYPDGEVLTYKYNSGGLLESASGTLGAQSFNYISRLEYDKFEQRVFLEVGNKAYTTYTYDANNRRLANLNSVTTYVPEVEVDSEHHTVQPAPVPVTVNFQNLRYGYDNVGNILSLQNDIPVPSVPSEELRVKSEESGKKNSNLSSGSGDHVMYGPTSQTFGYDDLYRLVSARGTYTPAVDRVDRYSLTMSYDSIHNITRKNQLHEVMHSDDSSSEHGATPKVSFHREDKTSYDWVYSYTGTHPHAPTYIGDNPATFVTDEEHHPSGRNFYYDANGNQIGYAKVSPEEARRAEAQKSRGDKGKGNGKGDVMPGQAENPEDLRTIVWDEENRIVSISDHGHTQRYVYNDRGERVIKAGSEGRTVYVNQYYTVKDGTQVSKHVFAGPNRIATRVTHGDGTDHSHESQSRDQGHEGPEEQNIYFYHPDHLGSTGYVTDAKGRLYEHMEYFPFGETWVEEDQGSKLPYLFTSKELDTETGLYYYGARYYDPRASVWQSADPILGEYLNGQRNGGVYYPSNLALYTYTYQNPLKYTDPDGKFGVAGAVVVGGGFIVLTAVVYAAVINNPEFQQKLANSPPPDLSGMRKALTFPAALNMLMFANVLKSEAAKNPTPSTNTETDVKTGAKDAPVINNPEKTKEWLYGPKDDPKINPDGSTKPNTWTTPDDIPTAKDAQDKLDTFKPVTGRRPVTIPKDTPVQRGKTPGGEGPYNGSGGANETLIPEGLPPGSAGPWEPLP